MNKTNQIALAIMFVLCLHVLTNVGVDGADSVHVDRSDGGMVVSDSATASRIGREVLHQGGNAVDAAVATAFALAVSWPDAGNIGGGGFMLVRPADGAEPVCIDYRETSPAAIHTTSFTQDDTTYTQKAVGVPGTVRGLAAAHEKYGVLDWKQVVMPAVRLADQGVPIDRPLANSLNTMLTRSDIKGDPKYEEIRRVYGKGRGKIWQVGDRLVLPDLARTLQDIADNGPDAFYTGRIADLIVQEMKRGDGLISLEDLRLYEAKIRPVMRGSYRGYTILGAPPPSSGGTCIIEALNILENFDLARRDRFDRHNVHLIAEALRRAFADRARYLGDPDFTEIPEHLISKQYAKQLADSIDLEKATKSETLTPEIELAGESADTTHFSVIDADGMAVSNTYTLEASWGSRIVVQGAGFVLNNEMGDFNWFPGVTNRAGRIGTDANLVAPRKRMLSSQTPTILEKDGKLVFITGSPGGRTIISTVLCILVNTIDFRMDAADSIAAARMHHQWFPDRVELESIREDPHKSVDSALQAMKHEVKNRVVQGSAHSIAVSARSGTRIGVSDYRRSGRPAALNQLPLAIWDFSEPKGTKLSVTRGLGDLRWSDDIAGSATAGNDVFRIQRDPPAQPDRSIVDLTTADATRLAVEIKIDSAKFAGQNPNERLRLAILHGTVIPRVTARMSIGRSDDHTISVFGDASGGGTPIAPFVIADSAEIDRPVILRLEVDTTEDTYTISTRDASDTEFTMCGTGQIGKFRDANYLGLHPLNDFAAEGEYVDIDRIEVHELPVND